MKKITPDIDICGKYQRTHTLPDKLKEGCISCKFGLFTYCWVEEYEQEDQLVRRALEGNINHPTTYEARRTLLYSRVETNKRAK